MGTSTPTAYNPRTAKETNIKFSSDAVILTGYAKKASAKLQNNDILTDVLGKLETRIENTENAQNNINISTDTLKLTNYKARNSSETNNIVLNGDTINTALAKLDLKINNSASDILAINNTINSLDNKYPTIDKVTNEINDKLKAIENKIPSDSDIDNRINSKIQNYDSTNALKPDQINTMIDNKINALNILGEETVDDKISDATKNLVKNSELNSKLSNLTTKKDVNDTIDEKLDSLVSSAPKALDTLNELANALGNDPNFSTSMTNMIADKIDKTGGEIKGNLKVSGKVTPTVLIIPSTPGSENGSIWIS